MKAQMVGKKVILVENKKAKSQVWKCFGFVKEGGNIIIYNTSGIQIMLGSSQVQWKYSTTNLTDHVRQKHPEQLSQMEMVI